MRSNQELLDFIDEQRNFNGMVRDWIGEQRTFMALALMLFFCILSTLALAGICVWRAGLRHRGEVTIAHALKYVGTTEIVLAMFVTVLFMVTMDSIATGRAFKITGMNAMLRSISNFAMALKRKLGGTGSGAR